MKGDLVGVIRCPHVVPGVPTAGGLSPRRRPHPCGETATLVKFPDPFGHRSYCEEGHVEVFGLYSIPGSLVAIKGPTD